jgi:hypothetical protein
VLSVLLSGCGVGSQTPEERAKACQDVASAVAPAGIGGSPTQGQAAAAARQLDPLLSSVRDVSAHDAAVRLHQQLHAYELALRKDTGREQQALEKSREAVADLAEACHLPVSAFQTTAPGSTTPTP